MHSTVICMYSIDIWSSNALTFMFVSKIEYNISENNVCRRHTRNVHMNFINSTVQTSVVANREMLYIEGAI